MRANGRFGDCVSLAWPIGPQVIPIGLATLLERKSGFFLKTVASMPMRYRCDRRYRVIS